MEIYRRTGATPPDYVDPDWVSTALLGMYQMAARARRWQESTPLPLAIPDIEAVLRWVTPPTSNALTLRCMMSVDDALLDEMYAEIGRAARQKPNGT